MSTTQFAMVEELANLVKDNLLCKHLVLSMEDAFLDFLNLHPTESDAVLELEPMDPYSRLLMHRLAEIFGFAHVSVGEGETRHLVLERCPETSIPSILVSDFLFQHDEPQPLTAPNILMRRKDASPVFFVKSSSHHTLEEREAAYLAARDRIFSLDETEMRGPVKQRPRSVPVVARRMIAHALGRKSHQEHHDGTSRDIKDCEKQTKETNVDGRVNIDPNFRSEPSEGANIQPYKTSDSSSKAKRYTNKGGSSSYNPSVLPQESDENNSSSTDVSQNAMTGSEAKRDFAKEDHVGAAKRLFAHALGLQSTRGGFPTRNRETRQSATE